MCWNRKHRSWTRLGDQHHVNAILFVNSKQAFYSLGAVVGCFPPIDAYILSNGTSKCTQCDVEIFKSASFFLLCAPFFHLEIFFLETRSPSLSNPPLSFVVGWRHFGIFDKQELLNVWVQQVAIKYAV